MRLMTRQIRRGQVTIEKRTKRGAVGQKTAGFWLDRQNDLAASAFKELV